MQFKWFSVALSLSLMSFVGASKLSQACGTDGEIVNKTTVTHNDKTFSLTTRTCPGFATAPRRSIGPLGSTSSLTRSSARKRQVSSCDSDCTVECANLGEQPFISDCQILTDALEALFPETFDVGAGTLTTFTDDEESSCAYSFANLDVVEYSVCFIDFGFNGIIVGDDCFEDFPADTATAGGFCVSPEVADDDWIVEVSHP
ncbi:hypothetical protein CERSUDRAFT_119786 [Gelatoporia subvermispora B]|uniref:Uncharacterized protein n=1 Tax=Ceriporiopsis subvermispora (strain B) TaxID=914234 RepID=M2P7V4_CERS8|nr:hypothetical protein CERSUDRAFT_119786 [Gelatoporia subvermispora B]